VLTAIPDRTRSLADGVLLDASIRARVLGLRLLRIDATVVLAPADVSGSPPAVRASPERPSAQSAGVLARRSGAAGHGLAEAVRNIDEGAALLADSLVTGMSEKR
jgi:hypothetical protein